MILPGHPDMMSDEELEQWMLQLIERRAEESLFLDYKQCVSTSSRHDRSKVAKEVTSFANEKGGVLLYGVPETQVDGVPVPVKADEIGMAPIEGLPETIENILMDAVTPGLPELRIRILSAPNTREEVVYLVWHPESWEAPHMVHAYGEKRFYRRGNYRAVPMDEADIERLYRRRQSRHALVERFFEEADFGEYLFPPEQLLARLVVCPGLLSENRVDFSRKEWRDWLSDNRPIPSSAWKPSSGGVQLLDHTIDTYRLFRNGAASLCSSDVVVPISLSAPGSRGNTDGRDEAPEPKLSGFRFMQSILGFLRFAGAFFEKAGMTGEALIDVTLQNVEDLELDYNLPGVVRAPQQSLRWRQTSLQFRVLAAFTEFWDDERRLTLTRRILDRLGHCFGVWSFSEYYDGVSWR